MDASLRLISGVPETLILTLCAGFLDGVFGEHDSEPFKEKRDRAVRGSISLPPPERGLRVEDGDLSTHPRDSGQAGDRQILAR